MKKINKAIIIMFIIILLPLTWRKNVYASSISMTGPGTVRAGDTIEVVLNVTDSGKYGIEATLSYDSSKLTLVGVNSGISGWVVENNGGKVIVYDDKLTNPIKGTVGAIRATFKVKASLAAGTNISVTMSNVTLSDGNNNAEVGSATYSKSLTAPLSGNANLSALSVASANLSPAFSAGNTSYNIGEVDFSVSSLNISYNCEDPKSRVSISGNNLAVGSNTVTVSVTAENGAVKNYQIKVTRKQDPNYVASSNATLNSITVDKGILSPAFSKDIDEYVVYLPYEISTINITGTAADAKAIGVQNVSVDSLKKGENKLELVCTAEDGSKKSYYITAYVMPEYEGGQIKHEIEETETESETVIESENTTTTIDKEETKKPEDVNSEKTGIKLWLVILIAVICIGIGSGITFIIMNGKNNKR